MYMQEYRSTLNQTNDTWPHEYSLHSSMKEGGIKRERKRERERKKEREREGEREREKVTNRKKTVLV